MSRIRAGLGLLALGALFAEPGHVVAYWLHRPAEALPGDPAHAYFLPTLEGVLAVIAAGLLAALMLLALARLLAGRRARRPAGGGASLAVLFTCLLAVQMAVFLVQEGLEAHAAPGLATVALGLLGQQPVALAVALALRWLSARVPAAVRELAERPAVGLFRPAWAGIPPPAFVALSRPAVRPAPNASRGPPRLS